MVVLGTSLTLLATVSTHKAEDANANAEMSNQEERHQLETTHQSTNRGALLANFPHHEVHHTKAVCSP